MTLLTALAAVTLRTLVAIALSLTAVLPAAAATIPEFEVDLHFVGCEAVNGYYLTWSPAEHPNQEAAYAEILSAGLAPNSATWGATSPLEFGSGAPVYPPDSFEEAGYATGDAFFALLATDGTVVYESEFAVTRPPDAVPFFTLRATLDCSAIPYRSVPMPDAAMPMPDERPFLGTLMLSVAALSVVVAVSRKRRAR